jgi:WD40 repeat protein
MPYAEEDAPFFFGRDKEKRLICANLFASSLSVLYGPSGVGKSSVLHAGVAPVLRKRDDILLATFNTWESDPLKEIKNAISKALPPREAGNGSPKESDSLPLYLLECSKMLERRLMIIFDQFEEYFFLREADDQFTEEFSVAVNQTDLPVSFLISIREDSMAKLDRFEGRIPSLFDCILRIEHLNRSSARDAILKPVEQYNTLLGPGETPYRVESDLVEEVLEQVQAGRVDFGEDDVETFPPRPILTTPAPRRYRIQTPFLQLVMRRLWEEEASRESRVLKLRTLTDLGDSKKIAREYLDTTMAALGPDEQDIGARAFKYLVTPARRKIAYQAIEIADYERLDRDLVTDVLEKLSVARILKAIPADEQGGDRRYEISHDVLSSAIRGWRIRHEAAQEQREAQKRLEEEQKEAQRKREAEAHKRLMKERQRARVRERWVTILAFFLVVLLCFILVLNHLRNVANEAKAEAERQRVEASANLELVKTLDSNLPYFKAIMRGHKNAVNAVSFSPDGRRVVTASDDNSVRLWDSGTGESLKVLTGHTKPVHTVVFSPDGNRILTASEDGTARLWDANAGNLLREFGGGGNPVNSAYFDREGGRIVTARDNGTAQIWYLNEHKEPTEMKGHMGEVYTAVFDQSGARVVTASADTKARIWDANSGALVRELHRHINAVTGAAFSPDGNYVVTASADFTAVVWGPAGETYTFDHPGPVLSATFSPKGTYLITTGGVVARVWDVHARRNRFELTGHADTVTGAVFSPDEQRVVTISADGTARVWELATGRFVDELRGHTDKLTSVEFSKAQAILVTGSSDSTARVWDLSDMGGFQVTAVTLKASPKDYTGLCPASVRLVGSITVAGGGGRVKYRFVRRRPELGKDEPGPERELEFDSPSAKEVNNSFKFGGPSYPIVQGSFYIEVTSPRGMNSPDAEFKITCEDFIPVGTIDTPAPVITLSRPERKTPSGTYDVTLVWQPVPGAEKYTVMWASSESSPPSRRRFAFNIKSTTHIIKGVSGDSIFCSVWAIGSNGKAGSRTDVTVALQ